SLEHIGILMYVLSKTKRWWPVVAPHLIPLGFGSSYHNNITGAELEEENRLCTLVEVERGHEDSRRRSSIVISAFQTWMGEGRPVGRGDIFHTMNRLRKLVMYHRALQVAEWVVRERPYKLKEIDYSYLLEFTAKVRGIVRTEKLFMLIPPEFQNELLYNNLVLACLERRLIGKTMQYMKKMREHGLPIAPLIYNKLILLNESLGHKESICSILVQMKADGVAPNTRTYNILLNIKAKDYDIEGIQNVFDTMKQGNVSPNEITYCILANAYAIARLYTAAEAFVEALEKEKTGTNWSTLDILMLLYGSLRREEDLERTWELVKKLPNIRCKSYLLAVESFGKIGCIDKAEEIWQELMSKGGAKSTDHYNAIISIYGRHGLIQKSSHIFEEMQASSCKPNAITFRHLILCCLKADLVNEGLQSINMAENFQITNQIKLSTPWLETTLMIVEMFANKGNVEFAERFFADITKSKYSRYTFVYNTLLKAYVKANLCPHDFIRRMILSGARPDSESYSLVKLLEQSTLVAIQDL
ncbi:hypothetical protein KI387_029839, partial [Taxus chinensis]